jgi:poly(ribitol-phosphate) beta-N-acetylglucosaminyltransferase
MQAPSITVLITTYNYGHFIEEGIDSVLSQDSPQDQMEVVIVDDGSTDDTAERVKKYGSRKSNCRCGCSWSVVIFIYSQKDF